MFIKDYSTVYVGVVKGTVVQVFLKNLTSQTRELGEKKVSLTHHGRLIQDRSTTQP